MGNWERIIEYMAQEIPDQTVPQTPDRPLLNLTPKQWISIGVIAALLIVLAVVAVGMKMLPNTYLIEGQYTNAKLMKLSVFGLKDKEVNVSGELSDYAMGGRTRVAIVRNAETGAQDLVQLSPKEVALTSDGIGKAAAAVSEDGKHVAFARRADNQVGGDSSPYISRWEVAVINLDDGTVREFGQGFAPQFFTKDGVQYVLFTTRVGVSISDVASGATKTITFMNPGVIDYAAIVARDGSYFAVPNPVSQAYDVFTLTAVAPEISYTHYAVAPTRFISGVLEDGVLMGVARDTAGVARLWHVPLTEGLLTGEVVRELPTNAHYRLVQE